MSNRVILIFLGVIFLIIIVLSSQKLSVGIRNKAAGLFPSIKTVPTSTPEGASLSTTPSLTPTPTTAHFARNKNTPSQTPNTGAGSLSLIILGVAGASGFVVKRLSTEARLR